MLRFWRKCIPLMLVYLSTTYTLYELLIMNLSVHKRSANGKTPVSLSVLCKIRYQQPADNVYRVLQHAVITLICQRFPCIPYSGPCSIPYSILQLLQFPDHTTSMHACRRKVRSRNELPSRMRPSLAHSAPTIAAVWYTDALPQCFTVRTGRYTTLTVQYNSSGAYLYGKRVSR